MEKQYHIKCLNSSKKSVRNYGLDFLRIFAMINIIILHIHLITKELNYNYYSLRFQSVWLSETLAYWAVNGFGIISGIVGHKRHKFSNMILIWFKTCFYSSITSFYNYIKYKEKRKIKELLKSFFPLINIKSWYIKAYLCMYPFLPIINNGLNKCSRDLLGNAIIILISFYTIYDIMVAIVINKNVRYNFLNEGYTPLWLIILYIIGGYLEKYILFASKKYNIFNHIFWLLIYFCSSFFSYGIFIILLKRKSKIFNKILISYISPTILLQAVSLIFIFSRLNFKNERLKAIISFFTPLNLSVTLLHRRFMSAKFIKYFKELSPNFLIFKSYGLSILIYISCAFIDYFRFLLFKMIKMKELCIFIEHSLHKLKKIIIN